MRSLSPVAFILLFTSKVTLVKTHSAEYCTQQCLDASKCEANGCYYSWRTMHCYPSQADSLSASAHTTSPSGFYSCFNAGGRELVDSDGYLFKNDQSGSAFGNIGKYDNNGAYIHKASGQNVPIYQSGRQGPVILVNVPFQGTNDNMQVRLFFAELSVRIRDIRNMQIYFNGKNGIRVNMDLLKDAGFATAHIVYFPISRSGNNLYVYGQHSYYPQNGYPQISIKPVYPFRAPFAILSGACSHKMSNCHKYCGKDYLCSNNGCIYNRRTQHCVDSSQGYTNEQCQDLVSNLFGGLKICKSCVNNSYCSFDPGSRQCRSKKSYGGGYVSASQCDADNRLKQPTKEDLCRQYKQRKMKPGTGKIYIRH